MYLNALALVTSVRNRLFISFRLQKKMPGRLSTSDVDMNSDEDRKSRRSNKTSARPKSPNSSARDRDASRSRSRERKKHKKHKKEKKKRRHRSESAGDTGGEGGDTPTQGRRTATPPPPGKYLQHLSPPQQCFGSVCFRAS